MKITKEVVKWGIVSGILGYILLPACYETINKHEYTIAGSSNLLIISLALVGIPAAVSLYNFFSN